MKRVVILLSLSVLLAVSCEMREKEPQVSNVNFTTCRQSELRSSSDLSSKVDVEFLNGGVQIKYYHFEVRCDFTTVNVTHTFVNGVLNITQQGDGSARCICYTDVSYTISGISQNHVNVVFINGVQVYCYNEENQSRCDQDVVISQTEYEKAPNNPVSIIEMKIAANCLKIKISSSGCSGNTWIIKLIGQGNYNKSDPPQTSLRLSLENKELCDAVITKDVSFNLEPLIEYFKHHGTNKLYLNVSGKGILFEY